MDKRCKQNSNHAERKRPWCNAARNEARGQGGKEDNEVIEQGVFGIQVSGLLP